MLFRSHENKESVLCVLQDEEEKYEKLYLAQRREVNVLRIDRNVFST